MLQTSTLRSLLILLCAALLPSCVEPDAIALDDDMAENDPDETGTRQPYATCPNGGKVNPATPSFTSGADGYASYDGQDTCAPTARPGVEAFRDLVLKTYPCTSSGGITRACSIGGTSEHKEGRAWDWMIAVGHPAADALLSWLLATDSKGNKHANARRVGIMYMIWNKKIWKSYQASSGWQSYTGSNPHTDHVHFSFSWNGANKKTTFWSAPAPAPTPTPAPAPAPPPAPPAPPADKPVKGFLDGASCSEGISGWAQDPDTAATALQVELYLDSAAGIAGATPIVLKANQSRSDLCTAIGSCEHGFLLPIPASFVDGAEHTVRAYAIGNDGKRAELTNSGRSFRCGSAQPVEPAPPPVEESPAQPEASEPDQSWGQGTGATKSPTPSEGPEQTQLGGGCSLGGDRAQDGLPILALLGCWFFWARRRR